MAIALPYKISTLVFIRDARGRFLLMLRRKDPNKGLWSCLGGKLEMDRGESPFECAIRETREECGMELQETDLHLFCIIAEKNYEARNHWLMFLFNCRKPVESLPADIDEGLFAFHAPEAIDELPLPETDRDALWPVYFEHRDDFIMLRADCTPGRKPLINVEESLLNCR
jgi:8-oxo-dGTP diphosphatase